MLGAALALGALFLLQACGADEEKGPITRQQYVDAYVDILLATDEERDAMAASRVAAEILEARGLTEEDLLEFANRHSEDPEFLAEVWLEIEMKLRDPEPEDSVDVDTLDAGRRDSDK